MKHTFILFLIASLTLLFTACGSGDNESDINSNNPTKCYILDWETKDKFDMSDTFTIKFTPPTYITQVSFLRKVMENSYPIWTQWVNRNPQRFENNRVTLYTRTFTTQNTFITIGYYCNICNYWHNSKFKFFKNYVQYWELYDMTQEDFQTLPHIQWVDNL
jgi:hypothetical protein